MLVIVGTRTDEHFLRSQVGIGSESACSFGQLRSNLDISDSDAGLKEENCYCCTKDTSPTVHPNRPDTNLSASNCSQSSGIVYWPMASVSFGAVI